MQYGPAGLLGRIKHAAFSTLGTNVVKNLVKRADLSAMHKFGDESREKLLQF
jgi:hypothetical protein